MSEFREPFEAQLRVFVEVGLGTTPQQSALACVQLFSPEEITAAAITAGELDIPVAQAVAIFIMMTMLYTHRTRASESISYRVLSRLPSLPGTKAHKFLKIAHVAQAMLAKENVDKAQTQAFERRFAIEFAKAASS